MSLRSFLELICYAALWAALPNIAHAALYDTAGAHGYQRRDGKIATFPF